MIIDSYFCKTYSVLNFYYFNEKPDVWYREIIFILKRNKILSETIDVESRLLKLFRKNGLESYSTSVTESGKNLQLQIFVDKLKCPNKDFYLKKLIKILKEDGIFIFDEKSLRGESAVLKLGLI